MAEMEESVVDERAVLKDVFSRSCDDPTFRNKVRQLCASYLSGIWTTVSYQQINITAQRSISVCPDIFEIFLLTLIIRQINSQQL